MKRLFVLLLVSLLLICCVSCSQSSDDKQDTSKDDSIITVIDQCDTDKLTTSVNQNTESSYNKITFEEFVAGFDKAEFAKYNSPASENGLGGSKIYITGIFEKTEILTTAVSQMILGYLRISDGNIWLIKMHTAPLVPLNYYDSFVGKEIVCTVIYDGFSGVKQLPSTTLYQLMLLDSGVVVDGLQKYLDPENDDDKVVDTTTSTTLPTQTVTTPVVKTTTTTKRTTYSTKTETTTTTKDYGPFNKTGTIIEQVVLQEKDFTIIATSLEYNSYAAVLNISIENKGNSELSFAAACFAYSENTVNGIYMEDGYFSTSVAPGETKTEDLYYHYITLQSLDINRIEELEIGIVIRDEDYNERYRMARIEVD